MEESINKIDAVEENIQKLENTITESSFAMEILMELKANCKRWFIAFVVVLALWATTIIGFLWYQSLWDYSSESTYEANGIYALIDSNGNIVAQDVTQDQLDTFMKWWEIHGKSKEDGSQNQD